MRNFALKLVGETGVRVFSFLFIFLLARRLGAVTFGVYSTAFAFASIFMIIADLGLNSIVTREVARDPAMRRKILGSATLLKIVAAAVALISLEIAGHWSDIARQHRLLVNEIGLVVTAYALIDYLAALVTGKEEMGWEALLKIACRGLIALTGITALFITHSLTGVMGAMAVCSLLSLILGIAIVGLRFGGYHWHFDSHSVRKLLFGGLPLLGSTMFWILYDNQDILLLHHFRASERDIGLFWSASKVIDVLRVVPFLLAGTFFPRLARFTATRESFLQTARQMMRYALVIIPLLAVPVYLAARQVETLCFGPQFTEAGPLLQRLLIAFLGIGMNHICTQILIARDLEKKMLTGALLACVSNFAFTWWLIPVQGLLGVCNALILSEAIYLAFQINLVFDSVPGLFNPFRKTFG